MVIRPERRPHCFVPRSSIEDWAWVEGWCVTLSVIDDELLRRQVADALHTIARIHHQIHPYIAMPVLVRLREIGSPVVVWNVDEALWQCKVQCREEMRSYIDGGGFVPFEGVPWPDDDLREQLWELSAVCRYLVEPLNSNRQVELAAACDYIAEVCEERLTREEIDWLEIRNLADTLPPLPWLDPSYDLPLEPWQTECGERHADALESVERFRTAVDAEGRIEQRFRNRIMKALELVSSIPNQHELPGGEAPA